MDDENILVFSQGRSGGGTIMFALNSQINGKLVSENMNEHAHPVEREVRDEYPDYQLEELPHEPYIQKLSSRLENCLSENSGLKHNINNFSLYGKTREYRTGLWHRLDKMVFNYFDRLLINDRKSWLKWGVSYLLSKYTERYGIANEEEREEYLSRLENLDTFKIDISELEDDIVLYKEEWNKRVNYLEQSNIPHFYLTYENLYMCPHENRVEMFKNAVNFLDIEFKNRERVEQLFSHKRKVSGKNTNYRLIENLEEINNRLGPRFGFLY